MSWAERKNTPAEGEKPSGPEPAFACRQCGTCCHGQGGIVLREKDVLRLAAHLELTPDRFLDRYARSRAGKYDIRSDSTGNCVFFQSPGACGVHPARPDICRAWPFFRGNLIDPESHAMAGEYCPGINAGTSFEEFAAQGKAYLYGQGLACPRGEGPEALVLDDAARENANAPKAGKP